MTLLCEQARGGRPSAGWREKRERAFVWGSEKEEDLSAGFEREGKNHIHPIRSPPKGKRPLLGIGSPERGRPRAP